MKKKGIGIIIIFTLLISPALHSVSHAQELSDEQLQYLIVELTRIIAEIQQEQNEAQEQVVDVNYVLKVGSRDSTTDGSVTRLQKMLVAEDVYPEGLITGYYGNLTAQAVVRLKSKYDLGDTNGMFSTELFSTVQKMSQMNPTLVLDFTDVMNDYTTGEVYYERTQDLVDIKFEDQGHKYNSGFLIDAQYIDILQTGQIGEIEVNHYLESKDLNVNYIKEFDYVSDRDEEELYIKLTDYDDVDKLDWYDLRELKGYRDEWYRIGSEDSESEDGYYDYTNLLATIVANNRFDLVEIDFDSKTKSGELTAAFESDIFEYKLHIDEEKYLDMLLEQAEQNDDFADMIEESAEQYGFDSYEDYYGTFEIEDASLYLTEDMALYGIAATHVFDAKEGDMQEISISQSWYVSETELEDDFDLDEYIPSDYKKTNDYNVVLLGLDQ